MHPRNVPLPSLATHHQAELAREVVGDPKECERELTSSASSCIAGQARLPREPHVSTLRAGKDHLRGRRDSWWRSASNVHPLGTHQLQTGAPMFSATPISRSRSGAEPMGSGWSSRLIRRGLSVASPCH